VRRGMFITIEGTEGVGKSTNMDFIAQRLESAGIDVQCSREPGGTPLAERIREMLLQHGDEPLPDIAELLLFFAARSLHVENAIRPALKRGTWVLCDRFSDASRAYQGAGRGLDLARIETLADWVHGDLNPDLTILLDAPEDVGMGRAAKRGAADRLESEKLSFYARVRAHYLALAAAEPERFVVVDATRSLGDVQTHIERPINDLINRFKNSV